MTESFPRQYARTRGFNLGLPRSFSIASDGSRVAFLRTATGEDPLASLWVFDVAADRERLVHGPDAEDHVTEEERDRRERMRESQTGVVTYAADPALTIASFVVGDHLLVADLVEGGIRELTPAGPAFDARPDPTGRQVAYVTGGELHTIDVTAGTDRRLAHDKDPDVHWGIAEFVAAEEMERRRGYWWAPDGTRLLACRVDDRPLPIWHIASPIDPTSRPRAVRYPRAGTQNSIVTLHVFGLDGSRVDVTWDREALEYVVAVSWTEEGPPLLLVQSRDQRTMKVLAIDPDTGRTEVEWEDHDDVWTHITPGVPAWLPGGRLLMAGHRDDTRALLIDDAPVTPAGLQVDSVLAAGDAIVFLAAEEPTELHVWRLGADGALARISEGTGVHGAVVEGELAVVVSETVDAPFPTAALQRAASTVHTFTRNAATPVLEAKPVFLSLGPKELRTAVLTPHGATPTEPLPVLLNPYGGPHWGRVARTQRAFLEDQWLADQGFVVLVIDGRGTPYRGVAWEQSVSGSYADVALDDQVEALHEAHEMLGYLDLSKVAIRGWSYGGYLTLAAMLRRPDVFHAGISGAPVTDMSFYDTHYMERYLGTPQSNPEAYERSNVVKDAANLQGELLLIHGLADDNVYVTHALQMSKALMEAGRRHAMIPLSGITHRPIDEHAAENMLNIEVEFLKRSLGVDMSQK
ncbi:MAG: prolyl oligopeptidase family serine peptidase [Actinomycetota bacterium]